jgi:hypothetical protein
MKGESLEGLKAAFEEWRNQKRHLREAIPPVLLQRARQAACQHGPSAVARATKLDRGRLRISNGRPQESQLVPAPALTFTRVELTAPALAERPFAEIETTTGMKVRLFTQTEEVFGLLLSLCGSGGQR